MLKMLYGTICYLVFLGSFLYAIGFLGNVVVPKSIDSGPAGGFPTALLVNALLLGLFAVQHSVMARPGFKRWASSVMPKAIERSTYVLLSSALLSFLFLEWQPLPAVVWRVEQPIGRAALVATFWAGWLIVLLSTFMINHFDLFGLRQVYLAMTGKAYSDPQFQRTFFYKLVRHPIMLGFLIAFWATPTMTAGHLLFSIATTAYIFLGVQLEERDLMAAHGERYEAYRQEVPMLLPIPKGARHVSQR
jgi:protein-S-isoprenylcysteine O-methyltransferase Ste14